VKVLAIDYGTRTLGLAVWESSLSFPLPKTPIRVHNDDEALVILRALVGAEPVDRILLGLPGERDPGKSWIVRKIRAFGRRLEEAAGIPVEFVAENFSTREAAGISSRPPADDTVDSLASANILQRWLEKCSPA